MVCPKCSASRNKKTDKCFSFNLSKGAGRCNHCNIVLIENKPLEDKIVKIDYKRPIIKKISSYTDNCLKFFSSRLISEKTLLELQVTESNEWMPKSNAIIPTIQFNYFRNGELINVKSRGKNKDFKLFKDAELIFYNLDATIDNETIIIVEGEMDCLALYECGFKNVISVPNGAGLGKINFDYLDNCIDSFSESTKFILALDNDKAGLNLQNEIARRLGFENCTKVLFKDCKDANECLIKYGMKITIDCAGNLAKITKLMDPQSAFGEYIGLTLVEPAAAESLTSALETTWKLNPDLYYEDGYQEYVDGNPWKKLNEDIGEEKTKKVIKIYCRVNNIEYDESREVMNEVKVSVNDFERFVQDAISVKILS
jgi:twinkle protein